jgi:hypothetical protein
MKHINWRSLIPVLVALALFYALSLLYFSPVLEGRRLVQGDLKNWQGMAQEIIEHRDATGEDPLWTGSMFSGMPAYQITVLWTGNFLRFADDAFHGFLPRPASFLFLYLLGMYILMRCMRVDPWLAIVGAVAFGFSSYFFVILEAGHNSKANAIGYMPMVLGATILLFRDKAWWGGALLALFLGLEIAMNHVQVTYYMGIVLLLFALAEAVGFVRDGRVGELVQRAGIGVVAVLLALLCNFGSLWSTWEYGKYTTRGRSELTILPDGSAATSIRTDGLDRDYVTAWSYGKQESFTLLVPNTKGGASGSIIRSQEDLQAIKDPGFRSAVLKEYQSGGYINSYWGDQRFTSGPVYIGALVVLLMLLALARAEGPARWWVLGAVPLIAVLMLVQSPVVAGLLMLAYLLGGMVLWRDGLSYALFSGLLLTLVLSWGRNYMPLTDFFLDMVPGYSKFRAVTIILIIVELAAPVLAIRYLDERLRAGAWDKATEKRDLLVGGGLVVLLLAFALMPTTFFQFISDAEQERYTAQAAAGGEAQVQAFVDDLRQLRVDVFRADVWRSLAFVLAGLALLWLHGRGRVGRAVVVGAMGLLVLVDLWVVDKRYVNNDKERGRYLSWEDERASRLPFKPTEADKAILQAEWSPAADAIFQELLARTKAARADEKGRDRMVGKDEEELLRFAALRRAKEHRVLTLADPFNDSKVSYFHKSVGGYHGAKLKRYQELIEFQLSPAMQRVITALQTGTSIQAMDSLLAREGVLNMLNTRHLIYSNERAPITNTNALGSAWFVDELRWMKNADEEITTLGAIDPSRTALVDERQRELVGSTQAVADPSASIELEQYATNELRYRSRSAQGGIAVLSAIWYGPDWQAYIDGKPAPHFRANYVLRGIALPAGEHELVFKLESRAHRTGQTVSMAASIAVLLLVLGALFRRLRPEVPAA